MHLPTVIEEQPVAKPTDLTPLRGASSQGTLVHLDRNQALFVWKNIAVVVWRGTTDAAAVRRLEYAATEVLSRYPDRMAIMGIVETTAVPPSEEMRVLSAATNDRLAQRGALAFAGVFAQSGFFGSVVRGIVTGLTLLARHNYPFKVFSGHREAIAWFADVLGQKGHRVNVDECAAVVGDLRRHYEEVWNTQFKG